jgi:DNA repair protein RadD
VIVPRDYQRRAVDSLYEYFEHRTGNPLIIAPTGSGKSVLPAIFCREVLERWPDQRFMVLAHVKELLQQNYEKIVAAWPEAPVGLYSAGLGRRQHDRAIVVAGIQSVFRKPHVFGWRDMVIIDECHLLSPDSEGMYQKFLAGLRATNPRLKVVGMTATAYRLKTGMLHQSGDSIFTDVACEITLAELLGAGHVCPLVSRPPEVQADLSGVGLVGGEFNTKQAEAAVDDAGLTERMLGEVYRLGADRKTWLFFCQGVKHAAHVCEALRARGEECEVITGDTPPAERDEIIRRYKAGRLSKLCNANVLTTGFDAPHIDLIVMLRPTMSPGLYVQICGRGMRTHPDKRDCLVLDFVGNIERHGPITCVRPPRAAGSRGASERHERTCLICPVCRMASELGTVECADCGHLFVRERQVEHDTRAATADIMAPPPEPEWIPVQAVTYAIHQGKDGKPDTLKVTYHCGLKQFNEWVCFNHPPGSFPRAKAETWWKKRTGAQQPNSVAHAFGVAEVLLKQPGAIRAVEDGKFWRVTSYDFSKRPGAGDPDAGGGHSPFTLPSGEEIVF